MEIEKILSRFIWLAFVTAIIGAPTAETRTSRTYAIVAEIAESIASDNTALALVSDEA